MIDYSDLYAAIETTPMAPWLKSLSAAVDAVWADGHGEIPAWQSLLSALPTVRPSVIDLVKAVRIGSAADCDQATVDGIEQSMLKLHPWRKGPFELFGLHIDAEWRSDMKWDRLRDQVQPLAGRFVLDVGSGNGYYGLRMAGAGARLVIGIEPNQHYLMQFQALRHFLGAVPVHILPLGIDDMPVRLAAFDTVFSMGVIYHRRDPRLHCQQLHHLLRTDGELVLESLVIDGIDEGVLRPAGRYAKMRNVWAIPSTDELSRWLLGAGFKNIRVVDINPTTVAEQRRTAWMHFESLSDFLDPADSSRTIEGHPAPVRAILLARKR